ncbi:MAG: hypothetical protein EPO68_05320 [Planctomycetota bacterium]|nr:MAG: hypothetical protein EPO68_05320 [Planctomycetota bacterium]
MCAIAFVLWWLLRAGSASVPSHELDDASARPQRGIEMRDVATAALEAGTPSAAPAPTQLPRATPATTASARSIVAGVVRDERTGELVPALTVELTCGGISETCTTDGDGRFASTREFPAGEVRALLSDLGWSVGSAKLAQPNLPFEIAVKIGPTYPLAFGPWLPSGALQVRMVEHTTGPWAAYLDVDEHGTVRHVRDDERDVGVALVRGDGANWVRFPRAYRASNGEASAWLVLEDDVGQRWDEQPAPGTEGVRPLVSFSTAAGYGTLSGTVAQTRYPWTPTRVCAVPVDGDHGGASGWHFAEVGADGRFEFVGVHSGAWSIVAYAHGLVADSARVELLPMGRAERHLKLVPPPIDVQVIAPRDAEAPRLLWAATPKLLAPYHPPFVGVGSLDALPRMEMDVLAEVLTRVAKSDEPSFARVEWSGYGELSLARAADPIKLLIRVYTPKEANGTAWCALGPGSTSDGVRAADSRLSIEVDPSDVGSCLVGARGCRPQSFPIRSTTKAGASRSELVRLDRGWGVQVLGVERGFGAAPTLGYVSQLARQSAPELLMQHAEKTKPQGDQALLSGPPVRVGLRVLSSEQGSVGPALGPLEDNWITRAGIERPALRSAFIASGARASRVGIALDRLRYRVVDHLPYREPSFDEERGFAGLNRFAVVCERRAKAVPAKPPIRVDEGVDELVERR